MKNLKPVAGFAAVLLTSSAAFNVITNEQALAGASTIGVKDAAGATHTFVVVTDGSSNFLQSGVMCDYSAGANCATINSSHQLSISVDGGSAINANGQATMANSSPVVLSSDQIGPCTSVLPINQATSSDLFTSTNRLYICSVVLVSASAQNVALMEGTGTVCATGIKALIGGSDGATTASMAVATSGGFSAVSALPWLKSRVNADHLCLMQSGTGNVSGVITYMDHS